MWAYQFLPPGKESAGSVDSSGRSGSGRSSSKSLDKIASGRPRDQSHVGVERGVVMSMLRYCTRPYTSPPQTSSENIAHTYVHKFVT